jgi:hypothetical protein
MQLRADFDAIANWVTPSSSLLDLGCGDGSFLEFHSDKASCEDLRCRNHGCIRIWPV